MKRSRANTAVDSQQGGRIPWFQVIVNSVIGFGSARLGFHRLVPILLKKSLMISGSSDSVAVMRFAVEAGDDGAARSRSRAAVLFILS